MLGCHRHKRGHMARVGGGARFTVTDPGAPNREADPGIAKVGEELVTATRNLTPVDTGRLAASWSKTRVRDGIYEVGTDVRYARFVEFGSRGKPGRNMLGNASMAVGARYGR